MNKAQHSNQIQTSSNAIALSTSPCQQSIVTNRCVKPYICKHFSTAETWNSFEWTIHTIVGRERQRVCSKSTLLTIQPSFISQLKIKFKIEIIKKIKFRIIIVPSKARSTGGDLKCDSWRHWVRLRWRVKQLVLSQVEHKRTIRSTLSISTTNNNQQTNNNI